MHLVDRHRRAARIPPRPLRLPFGVAPLVRGGGDPRRGPRGQLRGPGERVRLETQLAVGPQDVILVQRARRDPRHEELEHARAAQPPHGQPALVPAAEVADDAHAPGVRGPHGEAGAVHAGELARVGAEHAPERAVGSLGNEVDVHVADRGQEAVRVVLLPGPAAGEPETVAVAQAAMSGPRARR